MKKFKTVSGYLRSRSQKEIYEENLTREIKGLPRVDFDDVTRGIVNSLLPQLGFSDRIQSYEETRAGLERLKGRTDLNERQAKALKDCLRWLGNIVTHVEMVWSNVESTSD